MRQNSIDTTPAMLEADRVRFSYPGGAEVFAGLSLTAAPGEILVLVGPSGCGKTTLLNLLSGFLAPSAGVIRVNGERVFPELASLGYVFQSPNLFAWATVLENIRFGLRMARKLPVARQREKARLYAALVGLEDAVDKLPHQLSGGMRQRVALARSLVLEPGILLMDEPFAALDAITRQSMQEELLRIWHSLGQTIVFITHDIDEAIFLADRVLVLGLAPQGIRQEFHIDLPRPRAGLSTRRSARFAEYRAWISESIAASVQAVQPVSLPLPRIIAHATA